jgi:hypothetical protein
MLYPSNVNNPISNFKYIRLNFLKLYIVIAEGMQVFTPQKSNLRSVR